MAQMPALIPKEVEIQRLKKMYIMVIIRVYCCISRSRQLVDDHCTKQPSETVHLHRLIGGYTVTLLHSR